MAPIWWIAIVVVLMIFGMPILIELRDVIIDGLWDGLDGVSPGVKSILLLAMVLITVIGLVKIANDKKK